MALEDRVEPSGRFTSAGVMFVGGRDPAGARVLVAHPNSQQMPRSTIDAHPYASRSHGLLPANGLLRAYAVAGGGHGFL